MLKDAIENSNILNEKGDYLYFLYYGLPNQPLTLPTLYSEYDGAEVTKFFQGYGYCVDFGEKSKMFSNSNFEHSEYKPRSYSLCFDPDKVEIYDEETVQKYGLQKLVDETGEKNVFVAKFPKDMIGLKENPDKLMPVLYSYLNRSNFMNYGRAYEMQLNYFREKNGKENNSDLIVKDNIEKYEKAGNGNFFGSISPTFIYAAQLSKYGKLIYNPVYGDVTNDTNVGLNTYSSEQMEYLKENNELGQSQEMYEIIKKYCEWIKTQDEDNIIWEDDINNLRIRLDADFERRVEKYKFGEFAERFGYKKVKKWDWIISQIKSQSDEYKRQGLIENISETTREEARQRGYEFY